MTSENKIIHKRINIIKFLTSDTVHPGVANETNKPLFGVRTFDQKEQSIRRVSLETKIFHPPNYSTGGTGGSSERNRLN